MATANKNQTFDEWTRSAIKHWHPDYSEERVRSSVETIYTAAQIFPDEKGDVSSVAARAQVINCLKIWRSYDYANPKHPTN